MQRRDTRAPGWGRGPEPPGEQGKGDSDAGGAPGRPTTLSIACTAPYTRAARTWSAGAPAPLARALIRPQPKCMWVGVSRGVGGRFSSAGRARGRHTHLHSACGGSAAVAARKHGSERRHAAARRYVRGSAAGRALGVATLRRPLRPPCLRSPQAGPSRPRSPTPAPARAATRLPHDARPSAPETLPNRLSILSFFTFFLFWCGPARAAAAATRGGRGGWRRACQRPRGAVEGGGVGRRAWPRPRARAGVRIRSWTLSGQGGRLAPSDGRKHTQQACRALGQWGRAHTGEYSGGGAPRGVGGDTNKIRGARARPGRPKGRAHAGHSQCGNRRAGLEKRGAQPRGRAAPAAARAALSPLGASGGAAGGRRRVSRGREPYGTGGGAGQPKHLVGGGRAPGEAARRAGGGARRGRAHTGGGAAAALKSLPGSAGRLFGGRGGAGGKTKAGGGRPSGPGSGPRCANGGGAGQCRACGRARRAPACGRTWRTGAAAMGRKKENGEARK
jgi:hypothetical protein